MRFSKYAMAKYRVRRLAIASMGVFLVSCAPIEQQAARKPLMGMPTITGMAQVRDPATGGEYFAPCSPCAAPSTKTAVQEAAPAQGLVGSIVAAVSTAFAPPAKPPAPTVEEPKRAKFILHFSSATAKPNSADLKMLLDALPVAKSAQSIEVRGFADSKGSKAVNERLSLSRANAVATRFIAGGISKSKVEVTNCATCYVAPNDTEEGRQANRRVEVEFIMGKAAAGTAVSAKRA